MNKIKKLFFLSLVTLLVVIGVPMTAMATSVGAQACKVRSDQWLSDANCTTNRSTVYKIGNGALRIGYYNGKQYGWGKLYAGEYDFIFFHVDLDGDRKSDLSSYNFGQGTYTLAYPSSSSSKRAFRACVGKIDVDGSICGPWW